MIFDIDRIEERIAFIRKNVTLLDELGRRSEFDFLSDQRNFYTAAHALQISIEAMLDILLHMVVRMHLGAPADDHETLELAQEKGLISKEHFQRYFKMNKFRNKVVHGYLDVDATKVYETL